MKYQRAAIILATAALICPVRSDALDTKKHAHDVSNTRPSPMYGYCIGCVALTHTSDNESTAKTTASSIVEKVKTTASIYGGPDQEHSAAAMKPFIPSSNTPTGKHHNHSTEHFQFVHQPNPIMISKPIHKEKQQPFPQDLLAVSLFLIAVAVGFAWNNKDEEGGEICEADHKFDLISKRLFRDDFDGIGLTPTNDDGEEEDKDEEEEHVEEEEEHVKNGTSGTSSSLNDKQETMIAVVEDLSYKAFVAYLKTVEEEEHVEEDKHVKDDVKDDVSVVPEVDNTAEPHRSGEWQPFHLTNDKEEANITEKEEVIIIEKPILNNAKIIKSNLTGSVSNNECVSAPKKVTKKVSFRDVPHEDEVEVMSVSSLTKKRKGLRLKLSMGNLCEMKAKEKK
jgi:hypothetical protein